MGFFTFLYPSISSCDYIQGFKKERKKKLTYIRTREEERQEKERDIAECEDTDICYDLSWNTYSSKGCQLKTHADLFICSQARFTTWGPTDSIRGVTRLQGHSENHDMSLTHQSLAKLSDSDFVVVKLEQDRCLSWRTTVSLLQKESAWILWHSCVLTNAWMYKVNVYIHASQWIFNTIGVLKAILPCSSRRIHSCASHIVQNLTLCLK